MYVYYMCIKYCRDIKLVYLLMLLISGMMCMFSLIIDWHNEPMEELMCTCNQWYCRIMQKCP